MSMSIEKSIEHNTQEKNIQIEELKKIRCKCGAKMKVTHINPTGTAIDLSCTSCSTAYHLPLTNRDDLPAPGSGHMFQKATEYIPAKELRCTECQMSIQEDQAVRTFEEMGCALCISCEKGPEEEEEEEENET